MDVSLQQHTAGHVALVGVAFAQALERRLLLVEGSQVPERELRRIEGFGCEVRDG